MHALEFHREKAIILLMGAKKILQYVIIFSLLVNSSPSKEI